MQFPADEIYNPILTDELHLFCSEHSAFSHFFLLYQFNKQLVSCYTLLLKGKTEVFIQVWCFHIAVTLYVLPHCRRATFWGLGRFCWRSFLFIYLLKSCTLDFNQQIDI